MIENIEPLFIPKEDYQRIFDELEAAESPAAWEKFRKITLIEWFGRYEDSLAELGCTDIGDLEIYDWKTFSYSQNHTMRNEAEWWEQHRDNPRIVAVHGYSRPINDPREHARLRYHGDTYTREFGESKKDFPFDKGHFIGHKLGGQIDDGIFAQRHDVNRGWKPYQEFFQMERYAQANPGVFVFCRPIYGDGSCCPFYIEYGILRTDNIWWVRVFPNRYSFAPFQGFDSYRCGGRNRSLPHVNGWKCDWQSCTSLVSGALEPHRVLTRTLLPFLTLRTLTLVYVAAVRVVHMTAKRATYLIKICKAMAGLADEFECSLAVPVNMAVVCGLHAVLRVSGMTARTDACRIFHAALLSTMDTSADLLREHNRIDGDNAAIIGRAACWRCNAPTSST